MIKIVPITTIRHYVDFGEFKREITALLDLLIEVQESAIQITDFQLGEKLIELGVLASLGSNRSFTAAKEGPNYQAFVDELKEHFA